MHVALVPVGTRGDVEPMLVLGAALQRRGHEVIVGAPADHRARIEARGFTYHRVGIELQARLQELELQRVSKLRAFREARRIMLASAPTEIDDAVAATDGADLVVSAGTGFGAFHAAEKLGVPCCSAFYAPGWIPSASHAPIMLPLHGLPRVVNRLLWRMMQRQGDSMLLAPVNEARERLGLPALRSVLQATPHRALLAYDPLFGAAPNDAQAVLPSWPQLDAVQVGALIDQERHPLDERVERFLASGAPPVFVGFGSVPDGNPAVLGAMLEAVASRLDQRFIWSLGWSSGEVPTSARVLVIREAPFGALFPRCRLVLHHGGAGTTATALRAGVPQLVVPHIADQFFFGRQIAAQGLGPPPIPRRRLTATTLERALRRSFALEEQLRARARELAAQVPDDPVAAAVTALERWARPVA
ncbi:MAG: glycosyltransferase family 1 protein [Deltaproteobacteria bacterium]|nr:glycosyltransferase family 1 protein [Deltaproteobacteria bacterium]